MCMKIERVTIQDMHGCTMQDEGTIIAFDPPSKIIDNNMCIGGLSSKMAYIEIEVQKNYPNNTSAIFLSSSNSLAVFFIPGDIPIYMTEIVYLQIKEKLRYYLSLGPIRRVERYKESGNKETKRYEVCEYRNISSRVRIICFSQYINLSYLTVIPYSGGTCLGWVMYVVRRGDRCIVAYTYSLPGSCTLSHELWSPSRIISFPLFVSYVHSRQEMDSLQKFTADVVEMTNIHKHLVITVDMINHSVEMSMHLLSVLKSKMIYVHHSVFPKLVKILEMKKQFLSQKFSSVDSSSGLSLSSSARVRKGSLKKLLSLPPEENAIIICERLSYSLFFYKYPVIHLDTYPIKFFGTITDSKHYNWISKINLISSLPLNSTEEQSTCIDKGYDLNQCGYPILIHNTQNISKADISIQDKAVFHFRGKFKETPDGISLTCTQPALQRILTSYKTNRMIISENVIYKGKEGILKIKKQNQYLEIQNMSRKKENI